MASHADNLRRVVALAAVVILPGCGAGGVSEMSPEAEVYADRALESVTGLETYLAASEARVVYMESEPAVGRPFVSRTTTMEFEEGGGCLILTYDSPQDAELHGPRSGGGGVYVRRDVTNPKFDTVRRNYKPTHRFGPFVAVCFDEPARATNALRNLDAFARANRY